MRACLGLWKGKLGMRAVARAMHTAENCIGLLRHQRCQWQAADLRLEAVVCCESLTGRHLECNSVQLRVRSMWCDVSAATVAQVNVPAG